MVAKHASQGQRPALPAQAIARPGSGALDRVLVDNNWRLIAPAMAVLALVDVAATDTVPDRISVALVVAAMWLVGLIRRVNRREATRGHDEVRRQLLHGLHVTLPMLLFGLAIGRWTESIPVTDWHEAIGAPVIITTLAAVILNQRIASIIAATVSTWHGVAVVAGSANTIAVLAGGTAIGVYAAVRQSRSDRAAASAERQRRRDQLRAEQLLHEFEESGHHPDGHDPLVE